MLLSVVVRNYLVVSLLTHHPNPSVDPTQPNPHPRLHPNEMQTISPRARQRPRCYRDRHRVKESLLAANGGSGDTTRLRHVWNHTGGISDSGTRCTDGGTRIMVHLGYSGYDHLAVSPPQQRIEFIAPRISKPVVHKRYLKLEGLHIFGSG